MRAMCIADAWPGAGRPFTVAELDRMPDDGRRYELMDGVLIVSPPPARAPQDVAAELLVQLRLACPVDLRAFAEAGEQGSRWTCFDRDIVVISRGQLPGAKV